MPDSDFSFDPDCPGYVRDPYPVYQWLRENDPVHRTKNGCWVLSRYEDIEAALKNPVFSNAPHPFSIVEPHNREQFAASRVACNLMAFMDVPAHGVVRKPFTTRFHSRMQDLKPLVAEVAERFFAKLPQHEEFDFLAGFANPMAVDCICRFVGFPASKSAELTYWSRQLFHLFHAIPNREVLERVNVALVDFEDFVRSVG